MGCVQVDPLECVGLDGPGEVQGRPGHDGAHRVTQGGGAGAASPGPTRPKRRVHELGGPRAVPCRGRGPQGRCRLAQRARRSRAATCTDAAIGPTNASQRGRQAQLVLKVPTVAGFGGHGSNTRRRDQVWGGGRAALASSTARRRVGWPTQKPRTKGMHVSKKGGGKKSAKTFPTPRAYHPTPCRPMLCTSASDVPTRLHEASVPTCGHWLGCARGA